MDTLNTIIFVLGWGVAIMFGIALLSALGHTIVRHEGLWFGFHYTYYLSYSGTWVRVDRFFTRNGAINQTLKAMRRSDAPIWCVVRKKTGETVFAVERLTSDTLPKGGQRRKALALLDEELSFPTIDTAS